MGIIWTKKMRDKESRYIVEVNKSTIINAAKEGNLIRYINHWCIDFNTIFVPVRAGTKDTVFVRSIKLIRENEFLSVHYGLNYLDFFPVCLCDTCSERKIE